jgi:hypothetical protein
VALLFINTISRRELLATSLQHSLISYIPYRILATAFFNGAWIRAFSPVGRVQNVVKGLSRDQFLSSLSTPFHNLSLPFVRMGAIEHLNNRFLTDKFFK